MILQLLKPILPTLLFCTAVFAQQNSFKYRTRRARKLLKEQL